MHAEHEEVDPGHVRSVPGASKGVGQAIGSDRSAKGELTDPLSLIRERIRQIVPLSLPAQARRRSSHGTALVRFQMNQDGYCTLMQLLRSSGHRELDDELVHILHLAEPYPYMPGWVVVPVEF